MTQNSIVTDLNRCTGCLACSVACKLVNSVPVGSFWIKTLRIGPNPTTEGAVFPDVEMYFLPVQCQHCTHPECVEVCPTEASTKREDGTVQVNKEKCIGCQFCVMACPYGVRYLNSEERVVEKCTLCEQQVSDGELPQCVKMCCARARYFGDLDQGVRSFEGPYAPAEIGTDDYDKSYGSTESGRVNICDYVEDFTDDDVYSVTDAAGTHPSMRYILRNREWREGE